MTLIVFREALPLLDEFKVLSMDELNVNEVIATYTEGRQRLDPDR